jgi:hypothetical protein
VDRPAIAVPFSYTITGWGLSDVDRIRIVDSTTICGQAGAEVQPGGLEGWEIGRSWQGAAVGLPFFIFSVHCFFPQCLV